MNIFLSLYFIGGMISAGAFSAIEHLATKDGAKKSYDGWLIVPCFFMSWYAVGAIVVLLVDGNKK